MYEKGIVKKSQLIAIFYIFLLCLYVAATVLASSNITTLLFIDKRSFYSMVGRWSVPLFLILFCFEGKLKRSKLYIMLVLSVAVIAITLKTQNRGFAIMYAAILAFPTELSARKVAKWVSYTILVLTLIVLSMYGMGLIDADTAIRGTVIRLSCGFTSPNAFGNTVLLLMIFYIYYKYENWKTKNTILCIVISFAVFYMTNSRMSFFIEIMLLMIVHVWIIRDNRPGNKIYTFASWIYSALTILCFFLTYIYDKGYFSNILTALNIYMSYRLGFMRNYFHNYGLQPFGQMIQTVSRAQQLATGAAWSGLDNSYMYIMICWGVVISVIFCILYYYLGKHLKAKADKIGALCVIVLCVVGLTESYLSNVAYNLAIILIAEMLNGSIGKSNEDLAILQ